MALSPQQRVVLFSGQRAALDLNFATLTSLPSYATFTRTSAAWDFNSQGILTQFASGVPRLGVYRYDPVAGSWFNAGIDIEQAHTNLVATSAGGFNGANWTLVNGTVTDSNVLSPGGANTGSTFADNSTSGAHQLTVVTASSVPSGTTVVSSIFLKQGTGRYAQVGNGNGGGWYWANVDLQAGTITSTGAGGTGTYTSGAIQAFGNGWYRVSLAGSQTSSTNNFLTVNLIQSGTDGHGPSYAGTGTTILIWQADVIVASLPLTPVPTTSGSVAVNAETLSIPLSSIGIPANPTGLTVLVRGKAPAAANGSATQFALMLNDGTSSNRLGFYFATTTDLFAISESGGSTPLNSGVLGTASGVAFKGWIAASSNNFAAQVIGQSKATASSGAMPAGLTTLNIGATAGGSSPWNSTIAHLQLYNSRLSDSVAAQKAAGL